MQSFYFLSVLLPFQVATQEMNVWELIIKGGWLMLPIFLLSVVGVYIICERYMVIKKAGENNPSINSEIYELVREKKYEEAAELAESTNSPTTRMLAKGIQYRKRDAEALRLTMENQGNKEVAYLEKGLPTLATVGGAAPMIGFLGTVIGMVQAFYDMSLAGNNINITLLSRGIYTAMITTVAGLIVGIIAYIFYNILVAKIDRIANQLESSSGDFINSLYENENL